MKMISSCETELRSRERQRYCLMARAKFSLPRNTGPEFSSTDLMRLSACSQSKHTSEISYTFADSAGFAVAVAGSWLASKGTLSSQARLLFRAPPKPTVPEKLVAQSISRRARQKADEPHLHLAAHWPRLGQHGGPARRHGLGGQLAQRPARSMSAGSSELPRPGAPLALRAALGLVYTKASEQVDAASRAGQARRRAGRAGSRPSGARWGRT